VEKGAIYSIIDQNGAGRHYLQLHQWNLPAKFWKDFFKGENITYLRPDQVAKRGLQDISKHRTLLSHEHDG